jgi:hypothetical protein
MAGSSGDICLIACSLQSPSLGHVAAPELPEPEGGAGAQVTRDGPGAAPSWEAGAGAARTHGSPGAAPSREAGAGAVVLT